MGIIQRQTVRTTAITLVGTVVGAASQLLLPFVFSEQEQIGALAVLNAVSRIFAITFALGFAQVTLQVFSFFRDEERGHSGFLIFGVVVSLIGGLLGLASFYLFHDYFIGTGPEYQLIRSISYLIFPIIFFRIFFTNLDPYLRMLFSSVFGALWEGLILKMVILIAVLLFWLGWIDYTYTAYLYAAALCLPGLAVIVLSILKTKPIVLPRREHFTTEKRKNLMLYSFFGILGTASGVLVVSIDQVMVNKMVGTDAAGVYSVLFFAGILISIPARGLKRIAVPVLAESWKRNDQKEILDVYKKSVVNQTVVAVYLFVTGWLCIGPVLTFLPDYTHGLYVFFFIGLAQLFDMMTGVNMEIIATSNRYRWNTYFNVLLAILVIGLNLVFIHYWGIVGAAGASALAMLLVNISRWYFLKKVYGFQPFDRSAPIAVLIGIMIVGLFELLPLNFSPIIRMLIYSLSITFIYWGIIFLLDLAPDTKKWVYKIKRKLFT